VVGSAIRLDSSLALYQDPASGESGSTLVPIITASYKLSDALAPVLRLGLVQNSPPGGQSGFGLLNPLLGLTYGLQPGPGFKLALFLGVTAPIGSGGGDAPNAEQKLARAAGIWARAAFDNALFAVNDVTVLPGIDLAYVAGGFTLQVEATLLQLTRVRGSLDQKDESKTNLTAGMHAGYFVAPFLSLGGELRHQRWLSTPVAVKNDPSRASRDTSTLAVGPRFHFELAPKKWLRPALSVAAPLDQPMSKSEYKLFQLDVPFAF
jgi:hypothetical protein